MPAGRGRKKAMSEPDPEEQYNKIYRFFKTTPEFYDDLDWDGDTLAVIYRNRVIDLYTYDDLCEIIDDFR